MKASTYTEELKEIHSWVDDDCSILRPFDSDTSISKLLILTMSFAKEICAGWKLLSTPPERLETSNTTLIK
jgi:hypothetical protein